MVVGKAGKSHEPTGPFDERGDRGPALRSDDEVAFPMSWYGTVIGFRGSVSDRGHLIDKPFRPVCWISSGFAHCTSATHQCRDLAPQAAMALDVDRLVDRFRAHTHSLIIGEVLDQAVADLFR